MSRLFLNSLVLILLLFPSCFFTLLSSSPIPVLVCSPVDSDTSEFEQMASLATQDVLTDFGLELEVTFVQSEMDDISQKVMTGNYQHVLETFDFQNSVALSSFTTLQKVVQVSLQRSPSFSDSSNYPFFVSIQPSVDQEVRAIVETLESVGRNDKVSVICCYEDPDVKSSFVWSGLDLDQFISFREGENKTSAVLQLKQSRSLNMVLLSHDSAQTLQFLELASELEVFGGQYLWVSSDGTLGLETVFKKSLQGHLAVLPTQGFGSKYNNALQTLNNNNTNNTNTTSQSLTEKSGYVYDGLFEIGAVLKFVEGGCSEECPCSEKADQATTFISVLECVSPQGITGPLDFSSRMERFGGFDVLNWNANNEPVKIGLFSDDQLDMFSSYTSTGVKASISLATLLVNNMETEASFTQIGEKTKLAIEYATMKVNADDSVLPNHNILSEVFYYRDKQDLLQKGFQISSLGLYPGVLGCFTSGYSSLVQLVFNAFRVPQFSGSATSPLLSDDSVYGTFGRNVPSDAFQSTALARLVEYFGWTKVATINSNDAYGTAGFTAFAEEAAVIGLQVEGLQTFESGTTDPAQLSIQMDRLKRTAIRVFFMFGLGEECLAVFRAARDAGMVGPGFTWLIGDGCRVLPEEDDVNFLLAGAFSALPWAGEGTKLHEEVVGYIEEHKTPGNDIPLVLVEFYYDLVLDFAHAFDQMLRNDQDIFDGPAVLETMRHLQVDGLTGLNTFEPNLDRGSDYIQYVLSFYDDSIEDWVVFGSWTRLEGVGVTQDPTFSDNSQTPPPDYIYELSYNTWDDPVTQILAALSAVGILLTIIISLIIYVSRETRVVRAASPLFLYIILLGILLGYCSLFVFLGKPTDTRCVLQPWLSGLAFVTIYSALLTKTYRIYRLFDNSRGLVKLELPDSTLLTFAAGMLAIEILINILWTSISPIEPQERDLNLTDDNEKVLVCYGDNYWDFLGVYLAYKGGMLLVGVILSWTSRESVTLFNESKQIAFATYNIFFFSVILIPIFFYLQGVPSESLAILGIVFLLCNTGTLMILFLPKLYLIFFKDGGKSGQTTASKKSTQSEQV